MRPKGQTLLGVYAIVSGCFLSEIYPTDNFVGVTLVNGIVI